MRTHQLPIVAPCHEDWNAMDADDRGRFCQRCVKPVHDISAMSESEAQAFVRAHAGTSVCVRYRRDPQGRIRFRATRAAVAAVALAACTPHGPPPPAMQSHDPPTIASSPVVVIPERAEAKGEPPPPPTKTHVAPPPEPCDPPPRRRRIVMDSEEIGLVGL
jgi:hypothetical protein